MNTAQRKVNEKYFLQMMRISNKYIWVDTGNEYEFIDNKMKPMTLKGYVELSSIVRREFMELFVIIPENYNKQHIWNILNSL